MTSKVTLGALFAVILLLSALLARDYFQHSGIGRFQPLGADGSLALDTKTGRACFTTTMYKSIADKGYIPICSDLR
jgi:hypothetical protein